MTAKELHKETRAAFSARIRKAARERKALESLEKRITRHYDAGTIGEGDLRALDSMIMERLARLDLTKP